MKFTHFFACAFALLLRSGAPARSAEGAAPEKAGGDRAWVGPMKKVHSKFTGRRGTFAQFGDSITVTLAYWAPLRYERKNLSPEGEGAYKLVAAYMLPECWDKWKGPAYGSDGGMTVRWARENVAAWLKKLNPEVALIQFGTNDLNSVPIDEYEKKLREVVALCLDNGTVVILSTIPPRGGKFGRSAEYAEAARKVGRELQAPVVDFFDAVVNRRPDDWDGSMEKFKSDEKDAYQVPTLLARDGVHPSCPKQYAGDYSDESLKTSGYALRNYLTLLAYAEVVRELQKDQ